MLCKNCNEPILPRERWEEAGFDYCLDPECYKTVGRRVTGVAVVMLHKQGFNLVPIDDAIGVNYMDNHGRI